MDNLLIVWLLIPVVIIELGIRVFTVFHILKANKNGEKFRFDSMIAWLLIVGLINFGWIVYYIVGRVEE